MITNQAGIIASSRALSTNEYSWQRNSMNKLALINAASQLASIYSGGGCTDEQYQEALAALNEKDKDLSCAMIMNELGMLIRDAMLESLKKQRKYKLKHAVIGG